MNIKYCGPALDYSGYGEANRHDIGALTSAGIGVIGDYTKHCLEIGEFGEMGRLAMECAQKTGDYKIKILHTTPNIYGQFIESDKYHIGRVFWETDKLPPSFAKGANMCQEIWTGSEFNAEAIRKAGVKVPITIIPEAIQTPAPSVLPFMVANNKDYNFYSIFEWTERKNPTALLEAFWKEFEDTPGVSLVIKAYVDNFTPEKKRLIRDKLKMAKKRLGLKNYAPVYAYTSLMTREEIYRFHKTFDCYVSAHRGEGWGIPQMEAMLMGKFVVSTNVGGIHEYIGDVAKLIPCKMIPVKNVDRNNIWYLPDQNWGDVDIDALRRAMRWCFENQSEASKKGEMGKELVEKRFSLEAVGELMKKRLLEINNHLTNG